MTATGDTAYLGEPYEQQRVNDMGFEEWWKGYWSPSNQSAATEVLVELTLDEAMREIAKNAYRAGLLHAAEQDEKIMGNIKKNGEGLDGPAAAVAGGIEAAYKDSAAMHRQAASGVK